MINWRAASIQKLSEHLYKIQNLSTKRDVAPSRTLKGEFYLATYNIHYWHFIHEDLANYEGLKASTPELQLVLIDVNDAIDRETLEVEQELHSKASYLKFFKDLYGQVELIDQDSNIAFETAYFGMTTCQLFEDGVLFAEHNQYPACIPDNPGFIEWSSLDWPHGVDYAHRGLLLLSEKVKSSVEINTSLPKKIFITRADVNKRLKRLIGNPEHSHLVRTRYYQDEFLWPYFQDRGYEIVTLEELSYEEEVSLFSQATHVVAPTGAGLVNLYLSSEGTELYELMLIPDFDWNYQHFNGFNGINYHKVDLRRLSDEDKLLELNSYKF